VLVRVFMRVIVIMIVRVIVFVLGEHPADLVHVEGLHLLDQALE
jgi:hypothetical protein